MVSSLGANRGICHSVEDNAPVLIGIIHPCVQQGSAGVVVTPDALDDVVVEAKLRESGKSLQVVDLEHVLVRQTQSVRLCHDLSTKFFPEGSKCS